MFNVFVSLDCKVGKKMKTEESEVTITRDLGGKSTKTEGKDKVNAIPCNGFVLVFCVEWSSYWGNEGIFTTNWSRFQRYKQLICDRVSQRELRVQLVSAPFPINCTAFQPTRKAQAHS